MTAREPGMSVAQGTRQITVWRDPHAYASHPSVVDFGDGQWGIAFMESMRRGQVCHSPSDPRFYNVLTRTDDAGVRWTLPSVIPGYDWYGVECPSLTRLRNRDLLLFQWRWRWQPWPAELGARAPGRYERSGYPWARANDGAYVHRSRDNGVTWETGGRIETAPYPGAYTMRAAAELEDGTLLLPVTDIPEWSRIYLLCSHDGGATWQVGPLLADDSARQFSEPCIADVGGRLVVLIREERTGFLHQCVSQDDGATWSAPVATPMWGCPPHLLALDDGRLLCTYGYRRPPYGIRACFSADQGATWDVAREVVLRDDVPSADLGYPSTLAVSAGHFFTTYYAADDAGVSGIEGIFWNAPAGE